MKRPQNSGVSRGYWKNSIWIGCSSNRKNFDDTEGEFGWMECSTDDGAFVMQMYSVICKNEMIRGLFVCFIWSFCDISFDWWIYDENCIFLLFDESFLVNGFDYW